VIAHLAVISSGVKRGGTKVIGHIRRSYVECERPESEMQIRADSKTYLRSSNFYLQIDSLVLIFAINAKVPQDEQIHFRAQKQFVVAGKARATSIPAWVWKE
jgi:hypothetical protein